MGAGAAGTYTFERLADDLDELRAHLGLERARVLAHSMGGFVALNWALRHPGHAGALVLVGTTPTARPGRLAGPALRSLGPARIAKVIGQAAWYAVAWSWQRETRSRQMARYAVMAPFVEAPELAFPPVRQFLSRPG